MNFKPITILALLIMTLFIVACTSSETYTVRFLDYDERVITEEEVLSGDDVTLPERPTREGYIFTGWQGNTQNITEDTDVHAQYAENTIGNVINELFDAGSYTEVLEYSADGTLEQTNTFRLDEQAVYTKYQRPGQTEQEAYFIDEGDTYTEHVIHQQAACFESGELANDDYDHARENFSWRRFIPSGATVEWFENVDGVYELREGYEDEVVTLIGTAFDYYALSTADGNLTLLLELTNDDGQSVRYEVEFSHLNETIIDLPDLDYCESQESESFTYYETDEGAIITGYTGDSNHIEIPAQLNGVDVIEIGFDAFYQAHTIESVILPDGLYRIGPWAFSEMPALQTINIPKSVEVIDEYAFRSSNALSIHAEASETSEGWHENYKPDDVDVIWDYDHQPDED